MINRNNVFWLIFLKRYGWVLTKLTIQYTRSSSDPSPSLSEDSEDSSSLADPSSSLVVVAFGWSFSFALRMTSDARTCGWSCVIFSFLSTWFPRVLHRRLELAPVPWLASTCPSSSCSSHGISPSFPSSGPPRISSCSFGSWWIWPLNI